jgi:putative hydrolase of the HAD superfamily
MIVFNSLKEIKAISFDLDDTLYDNAPIIEKAEQWYQKMLAEHPFFIGKELPTHEQLKQELWKANHAIIDDVTKCRKKILYRRFLSAGLESEDAEFNAELMMKKFIEIRSELLVPEDSIAVLKKLKKKYSLIALTNGNVDIDKIGISPLFDVYLRASETLRAKPAADLFIEAAHRLNIDVRNILHVGDDPTTDVLGAKHANSMSCLVNISSHDPWPYIKVLPDIEIKSLDELESFCR